MCAHLFECAHEFILMMAIFFSRFSSDSNIVAAWAHYDGNAWRDPHQVLFRLKRWKHVWCGSQFKWSGHVSACIYDSLLSAFKEEAHILSVKTLQGDGLYVMLKKVIFRLEEIYYRVIAVVCDSQLAKRSRQWRCFSQKRNWALFTRIWQTKLDHYFAW